MVWEGDNKDAFGVLGKWEMVGIEEGKVDGVGNVVEGGENEV